MSTKIVVTVNEGRVRGVRKVSEYSGAEYYSFYGVPYAQPPTNNLRFKDPAKVKPWKGIYDATFEKPGCVQFSLKHYRFEGTEDCLFNNIHTPELPTESTSLKPVVVVIHGGGYVYGSPNESDCGSSNFVMHHNVVYVGIAYRLHILGFMNLGIKECSGNQGLKDIIMSLHWIKDNIRFFGGDPENVTLLGMSSGARTISTLLISPAARGIFHKAVIMGPDMFTPTTVYQEKHEQLALQMASSFGYQGNMDDKKKLLSFLKKINPMLLVEGHKVLRKEFMEYNAPVVPNGMFSPTIDKGENAVLPAFPRKLIQSTLRIPLIVGYCDNESVLGFSRGLARESSENNFKTTIRQNSWGWGHNLDDNELELIHEQVKKFYFQGNSIQKASLSTLVDVQTGAMMSDVYETLINVVASDLTSPVYVYKFQFCGSLKTAKNSLKNLYDEEIQGTFHTDDSYYWACPSNDPIDDDETKQMVETYTKFIATFARTGDPNSDDLPVHWKPTKPDSPCYLNIKNDLKMVDGRVHEEKLLFWDGIKKQFKKTT